MGEEVLGAIRVSRPNMSIMGAEWISSDINEIVYFTQDRTVVAETYGVFKPVATPEDDGLVDIGAVKVVEGALQHKVKDPSFPSGYETLTLDIIIKAHKGNYAIPNSEITEVELKKFFRGTKLIIKTREKHRFFLGIGKTNWYVDGYEGAWKDVGEKFENMLRPIFKERLVVKK